MAVTYTPNYNLAKYDAGDTDWDTGINNNFDTIDTEIKNRADEITALDTRVTNNETDISDLDTRVTTNETNIATNTTNISANTTAINDHKADTEAHKLIILKSIAFGSWIYPYYLENTYDGTTGNLTQTDIWEDNTKATKYGYITYTYDATTNLITTIDIYLTTADGSTTLYTLEISLTYDADNNILTETQVLL